MKCLSIQQPWAQYIAAGIKDVENRSWGLKTFPQRVLIHTGKKKQLQSLVDLPLVWTLPIENAEHLGIVPLISEMPTGAIIGVVDIVGCTTEAQNDSVWSQFTDDPEHPMYNLMLANAKLFKEPILDVKGKQGIFDYPEITEDNLPETIDIPSVIRTGTELRIPLCHEDFDVFKELDERDEIFFDYNLLNDNLHLFAEIKDEQIIALSTDYITFIKGDETLRFRVTDTVIDFITDDDGNDIIFSTPQGEELSWAKVNYALAPENTNV